MCYVRVTLCKLYITIVIYKLLTTFQSIMRPGEIHIVYTLEDSILVGGHFYSNGTLSRSLRTGLYENRYGRYSTNTQHITSEVILHRYVRYCANRIKMLLLNRCPQGEY